MGISEEKITAFQTQIFNWWEKHKRVNLPWRRTTDPYKILVAEMMLQQTQVSRVIKKYALFLKAFPTMESLAQAKKSDVLKVWSGLGYNRRALWLQEIAAQLVKKRRPSFPQTVKELQALKGIGPYTARAILIFAFNHDLATVDTNIRRIFIYEGLATEKTTEKELFNIAIKVLPKGRARDWHNALMDYGALVLTAKKTNIPSKSSAGAKRKPYAHSTRYYRGKIVRLLLHFGAATFQQIQEECDLPREELISVLQKMMDEGLLVMQQQSTYYLPK